MPLNGSASSKLASTYSKVNAPTCAFTMLMFSMIFLQDLVEYEPKKTKRDEEREKNQVSQNKLFSFYHKLSENG